METESFANQFTSAMDCRGVYLAQALAKKVDLSQSERLLDVAGGSGIYACSLCAHFPSLQATVFEKPPVDRVCSAAIRKRAYSDRVSVVAGNLFSDPLPAGFDVHLWSNVLHDWGEETVQGFLRKSYAAMKPGGLVIIHDAHLNEAKNGELHVAEYSVMLMHSTEGRCYSVKEISNYLQDAGFVSPTLTPTAAARSVIMASKPR
jgi:cyclopropane fatty-acyl-phospholipid synthase-like methyltransferase